MENYKITVLGDIMCEPRMLKAARQKDGFDGKNQCYYSGL